MAQDLPSGFIPTDSGLPDGFQPSVVSPQSQAAPVTSQPAPYVPKTILQKFMTGLDDPAHKIQSGMGDFDSKGILPVAPYNPKGDVLIENLKGLYNHIIQPLGTPSGMMGAASIEPEISAASAASDIPKPTGDITLPTQSQKPIFNIPDKPGRPEASDYASRVLSNIPNGTPGLSKEKVNETIPLFKSLYGDRDVIVYRDASGKPVAAANIISDANGKKMVMDFATDKLHPDSTTGVLSVGKSLIDSGITESAETISPDAFNLMKAASKLRGLKQEIPQATQALEKAQPDALQKLNNAITKAKPAQEEQVAINAAERAKRIAAANQVTTTGEAGLKEKLASLGGEYQKTGIAPLRTQLAQPDVDSLMDIIQGHPALDDFEKIRTGVALTKVLDGKTPQENEIDLLEKTFGNTLGDKLRTMNPSLGRKVDELVNLPKSLVTGVFHFSAPLRQGASMMHKEAFWSSLDDMFKSYGSEDAYKAVMDSIRSDPNFKAGQNAGLSLTDIGAGLSNREDMIRSNLAEKIPIVGRAYRASNRAFTAYLNKLRQDVFSSMLSDATNVAKLKNDPMLDPKNNRVLTNEIASYINSATGRGSLGSAEKYAGALNSVLFSPRLQAGRLQSINTALNPFTGGSEFVRKEALKGLMSLGGLGLTTAGLAKMAGADVSLNPTNPDFGKAKFGDTRIDPWAGDQQYGVLAAKLLSGHYTSSTSGKTTTIGQGYNAKTYGGVLGDFAANKLSPTAKFAYDLLTSKTIHGQPQFQLGPHGSDPGEVAHVLAPILAQNLYSLAKDNPGLIPTSAIIPLSTLGMGTETYPSR